MQTAFVTGSTGLLGNNLVRLLAGRGVRVKANTVHFAIRMAALKSMRVVGCGVRGRSG